MEVGIWYLKYKYKYTHCIFILAQITMTQIRDWNNLPLVVSSAISVTCFKNALNKTDEFNTSKKKIYSLGHTYEKILHTRLRLGLSGLSKHLFSYNLCLSKFCDHRRYRTLLIEM